MVGFRKRGALTARFMYVLHTAAGVAATTETGLVEPTPGPKLTGACTDDSDCYGGECHHDTAASRCVCPAMWRGVHCELLSLAPAAVNGGLRLRNESTWGGGLVQDTDDPTVWHMYYAHFVDNCGLKTWTTNSEIRHAVANQIDGPYTPVAKELVLGTFAHNPSVQQDGPASWLLGHIGCGNGTKMPVETCSNGTTCNQSGWCHSPGESQIDAQRGQRGSCDNPHWTGFHHAPTPRGPWTQVRSKLLDESSCGLLVDGGPDAWHSPCITNPSVWPFENGSALVAYSTGCENCSISAGHKHIGLALAPSGLLGDEPLQDLTPAVPIFPWASEDPTIFLDLTGGLNEKDPYWHILAHTDFSGVAEEGLWQHVAAHAVALDPRGPWTVVPYPPYNRTISWSDGSSTEVFTRERPQLIFSGDQWDTEESASATGSQGRRESSKGWHTTRKRIPVALTNGVTPGNASMPGRASTVGFTGDWSYTHVQRIDLG